MGTVVQAGICDLRKIIQWAKVKDQGEETNNKKKSSEFVFFTENFAGYKVLGCIYLTLNLQMIWSLKFNCFLSNIVVSKGTAILKLLNNESYKN